MHLDIEARPLHFPLAVVFIARRDLDAGLASPPFGNVFFSPETLSTKNGKDKSENERIEVRHHMEILAFFRVTNRNLPNWRPHDANLI
ncbi:hypothetical protein F6X37_24850 [Paraburkholderia sp. 31.1]|uniref:hypothetical protein n=1 Tax=Paraburkholderia sp. 31.1 TaxID=2615205 RepID=UPI00165661A5|nr:hypothetical protein [Paraburkholderia sp. 31.1]MBC8724694.1 hypothetical protein [Paraburkholderia sp. 31.1]